MNLENSLIGSYTVGTQEEIDNYVQNDPSSHPSHLTYAFWAEFGIMGLSQLLPESVDHFVYAPLFADLAVRWGAGVINSAKNYISARRSDNPIKVSDALDSIPQRPGLVGKVRELVKKVT